MEILSRATAGLRKLTDVGLALLGFGVVAQILFGATVPFVQVDVVGSIVDVTKQLGSEGLVGLVAVWAVAHVVSKPSE